MFFFFRWRVLPYTALTRMRGQIGYGCLERGIDFINFCLKQGIIQDLMYWLIHRNLTTSQNVTSLPMHSILK